MRIRKKKLTDRTVLEAALDRIRYLYQNFDHVSISFSGGKDSTACLNLAVEVARELGRLPVHTIFFDEEAIHPPTIEYVERVRKNKDVRLDWYCLPVVHRNACSNDQPYWTCWNPDEKDIWVREMPENVITDHPLFKTGMSMQEFSPLLLKPNEVMIQGLRAQESLRRTRLVLNKKNDNFIARRSGAAYGYPIYDWSSTDVWRLVREKGYDYNQTYDIFNRTRWFNNLLRQRVCPPYGEEPLRGLWVYAECWPEMWHKMLYRVKGAATAYRYSNTELYSSKTKPESMTWRQYCELQVNNYTEVELRKEVQAGINSLIDYHNSRTNNPVPDGEAHPLSGVSWKFLAQVAIKGDLKGRQKQQVLVFAENRRKKLGINQEQAEERYGKKWNSKGKVQREAAEVPAG